MAGGIIAVIVVAALLVIVSGVWVAIGLVRTLTALKAERSPARGHTGPDAADPHRESDRVP